MQSGLSDRDTGQDGSGLIVRDPISYLCNIVDPAQFTTEAAQIGFRIVRTSQLPSMSNGDQTQYHGYWDLTGHIDDGRLGYFSPVWKYPYTYDGGRYRQTGDSRQLTGYDWVRTGMARDLAQLIQYADLKVVIPDYLLALQEPTLDEVLDYWAPKIATVAPVQDQIKPLIAIRLEIRTDGKIK